jgi:aspartate racemase
MKTLGMIGGMSWESTAAYYKQINEGVKEVCGGLHSAKIILHSVDFAEIEELQQHGRWHEAGKILLHGKTGSEKSHPAHTVSDNSFRRSIGNMDQRGRNAG